MIGRRRGVGRIGARMDEAGRGVKEEDMICLTKDR